MDFITKKNKLKNKWRNGKIGKKGKQKKWSKKAIKTKIITKKSLQAQKWTRPSINFVLSLSQREHIPVPLFPSPLCIHVWYLQNSGAALRLWELSKLVSLIFALSTYLIVQFHNLVRVICSNNASEIKVSDK